MNAEEITRLVKLRHGTVSDTISKLAETDSRFASKYFNGRLWFNTQFNKEEVEIICKAMNLSKLETIYVLEHYVDRPETDVITITGTNAFIKKWEQDHHIKCCNTCQFCVGKVHPTDGGGDYNTIMPSPFCKAYNRYVEAFGKVYEDYCANYLYIDLPKARRWYKDNAPSNLDMYGEKNTVNGVDVSLFKNGEDCKGPVKLVNQIGFD